MIEDAFAPAMCVALVLCIFSGYPVAFSLGGIALAFGAAGVSEGLLNWRQLGGVYERIFGVMRNDTLLAVPYFVLMGTLLERSRLAEDLLVTIGQLFGPLRGGLALAVVIVGTLLAAATGVVGASVVAMAMISLPVMLRFGYHPPLAAGVIVASGTLGQIIPPSVVLVVLADQLGVAGKTVSTGDLFRGAMAPGLLLACLYGCYVLAVGFLRPGLAPALPREERALSPRALARRVVVVMIPPLALILVVLGSIFAGVATPTDAGALGALGAMVLALVTRRLSWSMLRGALRSTTELSSMVVFLLIGSTFFTYVFRLFDGDRMITDAMANLPGGLWGALIATHVLVFALGFFIDFFEIAFIVVPLVAPVFINTFGVDPVWFGVTLGMNLQASFLTPPFGFALFYLKGVCPPEITTAMIYRGVVPFVGIQLFALGLVFVFPGIVRVFL